MLRKLSLSGCQRCSAKPRVARLDARHLSCPSLLPRSSRFVSSIDNLTLANRSPALARFSSSAAEAPPERTLEEEYSRKSPLEHVLLRPGMYVGSTQRAPPSECWVLDPVPPLAALDSPLEHSRARAYRMIRKECAFAPALIKVFDEIIVNASDNRLRDPEGCTRIDVVIDPGSKERAPLISVRNDGKGIPVEIHKQENLWVPNLLFGHLLTGSNFDDTQNRVTGGRHGYGAKLANIFSREFTVETRDKERGRRYRQTWKNNMSQVGEPIISYEEGDDYTIVSFVPDMPKLTGIQNQVKIEAEEYAIMCRRVVDIAGCAAGSLIVTLNGNDVSVPTFHDYSNMYRKEDARPLLYSKVNYRWEVAVGVSENGSNEIISFVNGMATTRGGTHVDHIVQQVTNAIFKKAIKQHPELQSHLSSSLVRRNLFVSCNALIENPTFDSQMKESLTSVSGSWGSSCKLDITFLNKILAAEIDGGPGILEKVLKAAAIRENDTLVKEVGGGNKTKGKLLSIHKLEDAHLAGTRQGAGCTLILTEGDSAKALAIAGLEVIGRKTFGVFPLRGKLLNVREATVRQMTENAEIKALCSIIGLNLKNKYGTLAERATLRYGHVMLMTDQDPDGSHIKGLVLNFFRHFWPKLLKPAVDDPQGETFFSSFITPLIKVKLRGKKESMAFYSKAEYNEWRASLENEADIKKWDVKYYKGLGTSTPAEAKEYFSAFKHHVRNFNWQSELDGDLIDMLFDKKRAAERRNWLLHQYNAESFVVADAYNNNCVSFEDFVNYEMIHFSNADNVRSLPSVIDGLKPSQRKVLHACFKRKLNAEIKVAQLTGYCAEHTAYHHGETSLQNTIIGMAQDFVGSNNINLLVPSGQFGTRMTGGSDAASARYIFTQLSPLARCLFPEEDDVLLTLREDDGQLVEPLFFCPVIPLLVVNGSHGIGTGWSTFIPKYNPRDVVAFIRAKLDSSKELPPIRPWVRGFTGEIVPAKNGAGFTSFGVAEIMDSQTVHISELPIGKWTSDYKKRLLKMMNKGDILSFAENHTTTTVSFTVKMNPIVLDRFEKQGIHKAFKLQTYLYTTNMNAFNYKGAIEQFDSAESMAEAHFPVRLSLYYDRKSVLESDMNYRATMMRNKARFIGAVVDKQIELIGTTRKTRAETIAKLNELEFCDAARLKEIRNSNNIAEPCLHDFTGDTEGKGNDAKHDFDYLLNMPLSSLTSEMIDSLYRDAEKNEIELAQLIKTTPEDLWSKDLDKLESHLESYF